MRDLREIKSRYEFQLDNRQLVLIFAGMVLIFILVFILGIIFGRSYSSPVPVAVTAAMPEETHPAGVIIESDIPEDTAPVTPAAQEEKERKELIEKLEAEKLPTSLPEGSGAKTTGAEAGEQEKAGVTVTEGPRTKEEPATAPAEKVEKTRVSETKEPAPALPASGTGRYTIQVASSQNRVEAKALVKKLKASKYDAYIMEADLEAKGIWYRVRVGHYETRDMATKALKIIQKREKGFEDAYITTN